MARSKSITHFCNHCEKDTRMEKVGSVENQPEKVWYRCTRCRHAALIDLEHLRKVEEERTRKADRADATEYRPENTYQIGQSIFHVDWDDIGKIISKERTSGGDRAIVVSFERLGEKRLLENVAVENNEA